MIKNSKKFFTLIFIIFIGILAFLVILFQYINMNSNSKSDNNVAKLSGNYKSIEEILEYYECKFINIKNSSNKDYYLDINLEFKYNLYDGEKSNEYFFNNIIKDIAEFLNYKNFRLIDDSKNEKIEIDVVCDQHEIQSIYINGMEDYFIYMDSQIDLKKYKIIETNSLNIDSQELNNCIQNNWNYQTDFGTKDSIFQNYYIYFDEGIEVRTIGKSVYNIVFTKKYQNPVVGNMCVGYKNSMVEEYLGEPTFSNTDKSIIGYKTNDIYVFFEENQISVYRNKNSYNYNEFFNLTDKYINKEYSFKDFMNELTYIWPDYSEYEYDSDFVFISYPNKGIDIKVNYENTDGIILYNNIGIDFKKTTTYLKHTEFVSNMSTDNIFNAEQRRVEKLKKQSEKSSKFYTEHEQNVSKNRSNLYDYYMKFGSDGTGMNIYFISKDNEHYNCELNESIDSYYWYNDYIFVYSKSGKGIFYYNLVDNFKEALITGEDEYIINSIENGNLTYDNEKNIFLQ